MDWNIAKPRRQCVCGRELAENETYFAALVEDDEEFLRHDYCLDCWKKVEDPDAFFSFWKATVPPKEQKRRLFAEDSVLVDFFLRLEDEQEEQKRQFFYLLALILMRKKLLKFQDIQREGEDEILVLHMPREDRTLRVRDPKLSDEEIEALKNQLSQILDFQL